MSTLQSFPPAQVFIETGLGCGLTIREALQQPYAQLHSVEIDPALIAKYAPSDPRLTIHQGSSPEVLAQICDPTRSTVFWLDAHYSAGHYSSDHLHDLRHLDPRYGQCPLLAELTVIQAVAWRVPPIILIDDAVCFTHEVYEGIYASYDRAAYPTLPQIEAALSRYRVTQQDDGTGYYLRAEPA